MLQIQCQQPLTKKEISLTFLLLSLSGNPFLPFVFTEWVYFIFAVFLFLYGKVKQIPKPAYLFYKKWTAGFILLFLAQWMAVSPVSFPANFNFLAKFYIAFAIPSLLASRFRYAYFRVITFIALVSLVFFTIYVVTGMYFGVTIDRNISILFFNQILSNGDEIPRNSGMFWEPGAFQGYINLVPVLFYNELKQLWKQERRSCIILIIALITTFSTTGYVVFMFIIGTAMIKNTQSMFYKSIVGVAVIAAVVYSFSSFDFLGEKMTNQYETAQTLDKGDVSWSRFGAAVVDYYEIARSPITGNGFMMDARYPELGDLMAGSGNGFTGAVNMFGIIVIFLYLFQLFRRAPVITMIEKLIYVTTVILLLQGEFFLNYPMFWALLFIKSSESGTKLSV